MGYLHLILFNGLYAGNASRDWRQAGGNQSARLSASHPVHSLLPSPTVSASRKKQKTSQSVTSLIITGETTGFSTSHIYSSMH